MTHWTRNHLSLVYCFCPRFL